MFRFSIRDMLWLTVVVGMAVGWWLDRVPKTAEVFPHELSQLCEPGQTVKLTVLRDGYNASSPDGSEIQMVRTTTEHIPYSDARAKLGH